MRSMRLVYVAVLLCGGGGCGGDPPTFECPELFLTEVEPLQCEMDELCVQYLELRDGVHMSECVVDAPCVETTCESVVEAAICRADVEVQLSDGTTGTMDLLMCHQNFR